MSEVIAWSTTLVALVWTVEMVSSHFKPHERSDVKKAHVWLSNLSDIIPVLFLALVAAAILFGIGTLPLAPAAFLFQALGLLIAIGAEVVCARARMELGQQHVRGIEVWAEQRLVRRGLYGFVRHPAYLGTTALGLGLGLGLWSWALLAADIAAALPLLHMLARREERLLVERFGESYQEYQARVPMLWPWPRPDRAEPDQAEQPDVAEQK